MSLQLDDYERAFIDKKKEFSPDCEPLIMDLLRLFNNCIRKNLPLVQSATIKGEVKKLVDFFSRSKIYDLFYGLWDKQLGKVIEKFRFNKRNLLHIFLPIFLQEIEGPLKKQFLLINYLLELDQGRKLKWPEYAYKTTKPRKKPKFIKGIVDNGVKLSSQYPEIRNMYSGLIVDNKIHYINLIRRCIAHSDYTIEGQENDLMLTFPSSGGNLNLTFEQTRTLMTMTFDLILILHVAIHLGIRRKELQLHQI